MSFVNNIHVHCLNAMRHGVYCECAECQVDYMREQHRIMGELTVFDGVKS